MALYLLTVSGQQTVKIPVKRVHSRHRRFIAPGAIWDLLVGVEVIGRDFELRYNLVTHYKMDYLFGGQAALVGAIAAAEAAAAASIQANAAAQAAVGRKKRERLVFFILFGLLGDESSNNFSF